MLIEPCRLNPFMETASSLDNNGLEPGSRLPVSPQGLTKKDVKDVWCYNLDNEMNEIMQAAMRYSYIGMVICRFYVFTLGYCVSWNLLLYERSTIYYIRLYHYA